jgi:hypothetical protein
MALPRSGTSWLQGMLGNLPEIATVRETHFADNYFKRILNGWNHEKEQPAPDGLKAIFDEDGFYSCLRAFSDRIFERFLEINPNASIILEKTPEGNLDSVDLLNRLYPEAYFIHVLRDPRAVVSSNLAIKKEDWGWLSPDTTATDLALKWVRGMKKRDRAATLLGKRFFEVRYEDLKLDQYEVLEKIAKFIGLDYTKEKLNLLVSQLSAQDLDRTKGDFPKHNPFFDTRANFFRHGEVDSWKRELSQEQIIEIEAVCFRSMIEHGYQPTYLRADL